MNIRHGKGKTKWGPGVEILLTSNEVATAIDAYLVAHGVHVSGPRTIFTKEYDGRTGSARVYVDPSGFVIADGEKFEGGPAAEREAAE